MLRCDYLFCQIKDMPPPPPDVSFAKDFVSILYPKPVGFKFYRDSIKFICILFLIAFGGMCYCVYIYVARGTEVSMIVLHCLDIITIVVPPALPAAMTIGSFYAQGRLRKSSIFCISPQRINVCGKIKLVCFDKTGTLTEDGLDMFGVVGIDQDDFLPVAKDIPGELRPESGW